MALCRLQAGVLASKLPECTFSTQNIWISCCILLSLSMELLSLSEKAHLGDKGVGWQTEVCHCPAQELAGSFWICPGSLQYT